MYFCCISISYLCSQITLLFKTIYLTDCKYKALNLAHQFIKNCFINQYVTLSLDMTLKILFFRVMLNL